MPRYKIKQNVHPAFMHLIKQVFQILIGPVARCRLVIISYIIPRITKRRIKAWIHPDGIAPKPLDIVKLLYYPVKIPYTVSITILK